MLPIVALIAIVVIVLFTVFSMRKRSKGQDLGNPKAGQ